MTPEEKAIELTKKFGYAAGTYINELVLNIAKRSAVICCDEIINLCAAGLSETEYWQNVKSHIQSL